MGINDIIENVAINEIIENVAPSIICRNMSTIHSIPFSADVIHIHY